MTSRQAELKKAFELARDYVANESNITERRLSDYATEHEIAVYFDIDFVMVEDEVFYF